MVINVGKKAWKDIIISDTNDVPGKKIIKIIGEVRIRYNVAKVFLKQAKWVFKAPDKLKKIAYELGANAITSARFTRRVSDTVYEGTAVIVEDED